MVRGKLISSFRTCNTAALPRTWSLCFLLSSITEVVVDFHEFHYADDVRTEYLFSQLKILKVLIKDAQINCFADVLKAVKSLSDHERHIITEVIVICKLLLVNPATRATGEWSFSMARREKRWLRANMKQQRFNNVGLLHTHKARTDKIRLLDVANEFAQRNENRFRNFGKFTDLDLSTC